MPDEQKEQVQGRPQEETATQNEEKETFPLILDGVPEDETLFQFFPGRWASEAVPLTLEERGALISAVSFCWVDGRIYREDITDPERCGRILGISPSDAQRLIPFLSQYFSEVPGNPGAVTPNWKANFLINLPNPYS